jgi:transposase InsO family protein
LGLHRRAKLTVTGRTLLVHRIVELGWPACRVAEAMGVSRATAYKWLHRYREYGTAGLEDRSSRPHRQPRRLPHQVEDRVLAIRRHQRWGPHRLSAVVQLSRSTIYAILVRAGCSRLADFDRLTQQPIRYVRERPGELLHIDIKKLGRIPPGGGHRVRGRDKGGWGLQRMGYDYLHVAVDDASRLAYVQALPNERGDTAVAFLRAANAFFLSRGVRVERVLTDNGSAYVSRTFNACLAELGMTHKMTRPRRPQTNGKAERFNRILAEEWAYARPYTSNQARLDVLPRWLYRYNARRPHTALGGLSPLDVVNNVCGNYN